MLSAGLFVYDLLARTAPAYRHQRLNAAQVTALEPQLKPAGLRGGALYYDGHGDDARLTLENALDSVLHGAAAANYVALEGFDKDAGKLKAAWVRDALSADCFALRARVFVNSSGPWIDDVRRMDEPDAHPTIRLTKGVHLVLAAKSLMVRNSLVLSDGRAGSSSLSATVTRLRSEPPIPISTANAPRSGPAPRSRLPAGRGGGILPGAGIRRWRYPHTACRLRALVGGDGMRLNVSARGVDQGRRAGWCRSVGGKLTTHRRRKRWT